MSKSQNCNNCLDSLGPQKTFLPLLNFLSRVFMQATNFSGASTVGTTVLDDVNVDVTVKSRLYETCYTKTA